MINCHFGLFFCKIVRFTNVHFLSKILSLHLTIQKTVSNSILQSPKERSLKSLSTKLRKTVFPQFFSWKKLAERKRVLADCDYWTLALSRAVYEMISGKGDIIFIRDPEQSRPTHTPNAFGRHRWPPPPQPPTSHFIRRSPVGSANIAAL